jgi:hypothetical protein
MRRPATHLISLAEALLSVVLLLVAGAASLGVERAAARRHVVRVADGALALADAEDALVEARTSLAAQRSALANERSLAAGARAATAARRDSLGKTLAYQEFAASPSVKLAGELDDRAARAESLVAVSTEAAVRARQLAERARVAERDRASLGFRPIVLWGAAGALGVVLLVCGLLAVGSRVQMLDVRATAVLTASLTGLAALVAIRLFGVLGVAISAALLVLVPIFAADTRRRSA